MESPINEICLWVILMTCNICFPSGEKSLSSPRDSPPGKVSKHQYAYQVNSILCHNGFNLAIQRHKKKKAIEHENHSFGDRSGKRNQPVVQTSRVPQGRSGKITKRYPKLHTPISHITTHLKLMNRWTRHSPEGVYGNIYLKVDQGVASVTCAWMVGCHW